jgi:hypothetical protein
MYNSINILPEEPPALKKVSTAPLVVNPTSTYINTGTTTQQKVITENMYKNPSKEGDVMPCCYQRYCFSYDRMKYLPKNPKLKYRTDGTIAHDPYSNQPTFCDYNGAREAIRQAKIKGLNHVHWRLSTASAEPLERDGYRGSDGSRLMNKDNDKICWGNKK